MTIPKASFTAGFQCGVLVGAFFIMIVILWAESSEHDWLLHRFGPKAVGEYWRAIKCNSDTGI